jgi:hypothetical protein
MNWLRRFKFEARLGLLLAAFSIGFLVYGAWTLLRHAEGECGWAALPAY